MYYESDILSIDRPTSVCPKVALLLASAGARPARRSKIRYDAREYLDSMRRTFASMHVRVLRHATEELEKVEKAMATVLSGVQVRVSRTEGVHGNQIDVLEADMEDPVAIESFLSRLSRQDLAEIDRTLDQRVDAERNLFLRIDKQSAFLGDLRLGSGDDVLSVRLRVLAFPAKRDVAVRLVRDCLAELMAAR